MPQPPLLLRFWKWFRTDGWGFCLFVLCVILWIAISLYVRFDAWRAKQEYQVAYTTVDQVTLKRLAPREYRAMLEVAQSGCFETRFKRECYGKGFGSRDLQDRAKSYRKAYELLTRAQATTKQNQPIAEIIDRTLLPECDSLRKEAESIPAELYAYEEWRRAESKADRRRINELLELGGFEEVRSDLKEAIGLYMNCINVARERSRELTTKAEAQGGLAAYGLQLKSDARRACVDCIHGYFNKYSGAREQFDKSKGIWMFDPPVFTRIRGILQSLSKADNFLSEGKSREACVEYDQAIAGAARLKDEPRPEDSKMKIGDSAGEVMAHMSRLDRLKYLP